MIVPVLPGDPARLRAVLREKLAASLASPPPPRTPRTLHGRTTLPGRATAVIGMRRAGKTTLLHQWRRERMASGVPLERLPFLDLEDARLDGITAADLDGVVEDYFVDHPRARGRETVTWCLDEIQVVPGWERFVRRLLDTEKVEVLLTGSSAALLSREIATAMRGRAWTVMLHPFGFDEVRRHAGRPAPGAPARLEPRERSRVERDFRDYLAAGGFPEAQGLDAESRGRLLGDVVDVAMVRDVLERHGVSQPTVLRWLVRQLLGSAAGLFSVEKFHAALRSQGIAVAKGTLHDLVGHLEDCFLVRTAWLDTPSERRRRVNPRKVYPVDPGLLPLFDRTGSENLGRALETAVMLELERRGWAVAYGRTASGREIDFVARRPGERPLLVQVCADARDADTARRELLPLEEADAGATRLLLTLDRGGLPSRVPRGITARPAWEWMLDP